MLGERVSEKENMELVLSHKIPLWLPSYLDAVAPVRSLAVGRKRSAATGFNVDIFGVEFETTTDGDVPAYAKTKKFRLEDVTDWPQVIPSVDLDAIDWEEEARELRKKYVKDGQMCCLTAGWIFEELDYMMGTEGAFEALLLEPEACWDCMNAIADFWIDVLRHEYPFLKPDIVMLMDHLATQAGMMISPKLYRELIAPIDKKFFDAVHDLGARTQLHCDGLIEAVLPDFSAIGAEMIQPFQVFNDINLAKEKYGFIAVGGWDSFGRGNQKDSTEEEIRSSVRLAMDSYGPGGNYVFWQSGITPAFPRHQELLADEAREYGRSFYQR